MFSLGRPWPAPGPDRRRGRPGRHLCHPHQRDRRPAGCCRRGRGLQALGSGGARLPQPEDHRPGAAPDPPLARGPGPRPCAGLHAGLLPGLAPASGAGAAVLHRRDAADRSDPVAAAQRSAAAAAKASRRQLADGTPAHSFRTLLEHLATLTRNQVHLLQQPYPITPALLATPPRSSAAPSTWSAPRSHSSSPSQNPSTQTTPIPLVTRGQPHPTTRNFGLASTRKASCSAGGKAISTAPARR
jgi:hypothetical protein